MCRLLVGQIVQAVAIADGRQAENELAVVSYIDSWAENLFSRATKLAWLRDGGETGARPGAVEVVRGLLDDMKPEPFQNGEWPNVTNCFVFRKSGSNRKMIPN